MNCTYCKSDMKYGKDHEVVGILVAVNLDDVTHPLASMDLNRTICFPCWVKQLDWIAKASDCTVEARLHASVPY